jgi:hypothetical protein
MPLRPDYRSTRDKNGTCSAIVSDWKVEEAGRRGLVIKDGSAGVPNVLQAAREVY